MRKYYLLMIFALFLSVPTANSQSPVAGGDVAVDLKNLREELAKWQRVYQQITAPKQILADQLNSSINRWEVRLKNLRVQSRKKTEGPFHSPFLSIGRSGLPNLFELPKGMRWICSGHVCVPAYVDSTKKKPETEAELLRKIADAKIHRDNLLGEIQREIHLYDQMTREVRQKIVVLEKTIAERKVAMEKFISAMAAGDLIDPMRQAFLEDALRERLSGLISGGDFGVPQPVTEAPNDPGHEADLSGSDQFVSLDTLNFVGTFDVTFTETFATAPPLETFSGTITIDQSGKLVGATVVGETVTSVSGQVIGNSLIGEIDSIEGGQAVESEINVTISGNTITGTFKSDDVAGPNSEDGNISGTKR